MDRPDWLGWRERAIALAALGGAVLGRTAFAPTRPDWPSSLQMQVLVLLALKETQAQEDENGVAAQVLALDWEVVDELLDGLVARGLVAHVPVELDPKEAADLDIVDDEPPPTEPVLTELGAEHVRLWLESSRWVFAGWPPERADVDDAVG